MPAMRYFRRAGPDVLIFESTERQRFVRGPVAPTDKDPEGTPGATAAYEEGERFGDRMIAQLSGDPYWYEVDGRGDPIIPEPELEVDDPPEDPPVDDPPATLLGTPLPTGTPETPVPTGAPPPPNPDQTRGGAENAPEGTPETKETA